MWRKASYRLEDWRSFFRLVAPINKLPAIHMKSVLNKILRPERKQLIYFSFLITPILIYGLYRISFAWIPSFGDFLKVLYFILAFLFIVTFLHDRYNKTKLKSYIYITTILLSIYALVSYPTRKFLKARTEVQAVILGEYINKYIAKPGKYPDNLNNKYFNDAPKRSYVGTKYFISKSLDNNKKDNNCYVVYKSF